MKNDNDEDVAVELLMEAIKEKEPGQKFVELSEMYKILESIADWSDAAEEDDDDLS